MNQITRPLPRPWGAKRAKSFITVAGTAYSGLKLDPDTQMTLYLDESGHPLDMGKHGTNRATNHSQATGSSPDGGSPGSSSDDASVTDYDQD